MSNCDGVMMNCDDVMTNCDDVMINCDDVMMSRLLSHVHTLYVRVYYLTCAVLGSGVSEEAGCTVLALIPDGVIDAEATHPRGHVT